MEIFAEVLLLTVSIIASEKSIVNISAMFVTIVRLTEKLSFLTAELDQVVQNFKSQAQPYDFEDELLAGYKYLENGH